MRLWFPNNKTSDKTVIDSNKGFKHHKNFSETWLPSFIDKESPAFLRLKNKIENGLKAPTSGDLAK